jgi:hypothetical protein
MMNLQDIIFLVVGIGIMVFTLVWGGRLGTGPVELGVPKLGLNLKADRLTLIFLLGFLMTGVGVFFRYRGYESQVKQLQSQVIGLQGRVSQLDSTMQKLTDALQGFKEYDLGLNLVFPDSVDPRPFNIQVYTKKLSDVNFELLTIKAETDVGGTWVKINNLSRGERIKIVAQEPDSTIWEGNDVEIPKTQIQMTRKGRPARGTR